MTFYDSSYSLIIEIIAFYSFLVLTIFLLFVLLQNISLATTNSGILSWPDSVVLVY